MTSLSDRARAEAERRTVGAKDPRQYRFGFRDGARWASDQGPTEAEVEAGAVALFAQAELLTLAEAEVLFADVADEVQDRYRLDARTATLAARDARRAGR